MRLTTSTLLLTWILAAPLLAQTGAASITGLVTDPSGAAAAGAAVTATSQATGVRNRALANAAGLYALTRSALRRAARSAVRTAPRLP